VGLIRRLFGNGARTRRTDEAHAQRAMWRKCRLESLEQRQLLAADPVILGITYLEADLGQDVSPDHFEVTYVGGSPTTQLTQFVLNGDHDNSGTVTTNDMIFHVTEAGPGTAGYHPFSFDAARSLGLSASDVLSWNVSNNGLTLTVTLRNFQAGDRLAFSIDVDEVENDRFDKIASGVEFEGTRIFTTFVDPHYNFVPRPLSVQHVLEGGVVQTQTPGKFYDEYDQLFAAAGAVVGKTLALPGDNQGGMSDRTDGGVCAFNLTPKPITISGQVYHDLDLDCARDAGEQGIAGVTLRLDRWNAQTASYEKVATTTTNASGQYHFGVDLNLAPGRYRVVEIQPDGYLSVGASPGTVEGTASGVVKNSSDGHPNVLAEIDVPLGNNAAVGYDFCEVRPATLAGNVYHDRNDNGVRDPGEEGLVNVLVQITRVGGHDSLAHDPFENTDPFFVRTDATGHYSVTGLPPGIYEIIEINNYPAGANPLAGFIDGQDTLGTVAGSVVGTRSNDQFRQVKLGSGDDGIEYNFGELRPVSINGRVSITTPEGECVEPSDPRYRGLAGVTIHLFDSQGNLIRTTTTNAQGAYSFANLRPGVYSVVEVQPQGYLDGADDLGTVAGQPNGVVPANDRFAGIKLASGQNGIEYNFCEHEPASISGHVWFDRDDDGQRESGENGIANVTVQLLDAAGNVVATDQTDANGFYRFDNLLGGIYSIRELQPNGYVDGRDKLGSVDGATQGTNTNDHFRNIRLLNGQTGVNYDFGEIQFASIMGRIHADTGPESDCEYDAPSGDRLLGGVTVLLLDAQGVEVARTTTNAQGVYTFTGLRPGVYSVVELQPTGLLEGEAEVGQINGTNVGTVNGTNRIDQIQLTAGQKAQYYNFCEHVPAQIGGHVWHDRNNDGVWQMATEPGIAGTTVRLLDDTGAVVATTQTNANGRFQFGNLYAGTYTIVEVQPSGYVDGRDILGMVGGISVGQVEGNDRFGRITIRGGQSGDNYNFGEYQLASIDGMVHTDNNGNCLLDESAGERPLAGVQVQLLDGNGNVVATTTTNADGEYHFGGLRPGVYTVREIQPGAYFDMGQAVGRDAAGGAATGDASGKNAIATIHIVSGQRLVEYNFCEQAPAQIHGRVFEDGPAFQTENGQLPDGYRQLRDGVFQPGTDRPLAGVRMALYYYIDPASNEIAPRPVTLGEVLPGLYSHVGSDPNAPIWVMTDANGEYRFGGLRAGNYIVVEMQPTELADANDTPGSTTGLAFNSDFAASTAPQSVLQVFSTQQVMDSIVNIRINAGAVSVENNFSEVRAVQAPDTPPTTPPPLVPPSHPTPPSPPLSPGWGLAGALPINQVTIIGSIYTPFDKIALPHTWHLSVIDAGNVRDNEASEDQVAMIGAGHLNTEDWTKFDATDGHWSLNHLDEAGQPIVLDDTSLFGLVDGTPLAGDFNGDGRDELAIYKDGYWLLDLNGNRRWDSEDLLARLGDADDRPVVGDWDGDGKDDIGIYGPEWEGDDTAIAMDPGLPDAMNQSISIPKNIPPRIVHAAEGSRVMRLTSHGQTKADVIDHVFGYGDGDETPVVGDWNGDGIRTIGYFRDGRWLIDLNGDGRLDTTDVEFVFGDAGDIPLVGDFDGDGIEQVAVYRDGTWTIDSNNNRRHDATDQVFQLGGPDDHPVVGDWDGDQIDDPGLYRSGGPQ